jgi:hypothetical protein
MAGSSVVTFGYWAVAGALAVAIGAGIAVWNGPTTVEVPAPAQGSAEPPSPALPAPPTQSHVPAATPPA